MEVFMKKLMIFLLAAVLLTGSAACQNNTEPPASKKPQVTTVYSLSKVTQNENIVLQSESAHIEAAKGEYESFQIIITAGDTSVSDVEITISEPTDGEDKISADNLELYWEKYITVSVPTSIYSPGNYPDALLPYDKAKEYKENNIAANCNQGIWVEVYIPNDMQAGNYSGNVSIKCGSASFSVPYSVRVFDFFLPNKTHARTAYGLWYDQLVNDVAFADAENGLHPSLTTELKENYYNGLAEYRISPMSFPSGTGGNAADFAAAALKYASSDKISSFQIPTQTQTATSDFISTPHTTINYASLVEYIKELAKISTNENNLVSKGYFYVASLIDEPTSDKYDLVKEIDTFIADAKREVSEMDIFAGKDQVRQAVLDIPHLVTGKLVDELQGYVDTFCSTTEYYSSASYRYEMAEQQKNGTGAWWYTAVKPRAPMPSYHIDATMTEHRILGWQSMEKNIEGNLYWSASVFYKYNYSAGVYESRDVWNDPYAFPGAAGDGFLIYPGAKYGIDSFIPTLRLQAIRDGYEDYEYLWMLNQIIEEINETYNTDIDFYQYINDLSRQLYSGLIPNSDEEIFRHTRHILASFLESYKKTGVLATVDTDYNKNEATVDFYGPTGTIIKTEDNETLEIKEDKTSCTVALSAKNTIDFNIGQTDLTLLVPRSSVACTDFASEEILNNISSSKPSGENIQDCAFQIAETSPLHTTALKVTVTPNANARPDHTYYIRFSELGHSDFTDAEDLIFSVYNEEDYAFVIKPKLRNAQKAKTLDDIVLAPNTITQVKIKLKAYSDFETTALTAIDIAFDIFGMQPTSKTIYIGNIYITQK